ncbi:hypothetical protein MMC06_002781 [Schaereria dolodes]|nr:hypothetical protein [Schaereria dolodes]
MDQSDIHASRRHINADYHYKNLLEGQIRLLTIVSAKDETLELSLKHYCYDAYLKYDALSYAWNPESGANVPSQQRILCNSTPFYVSSDLSQAIRSLTALKASRPLWIDYICIDQSNNKEKEWQLKLMGKYYSQAMMVWIWLGPPSAYSNLAMEEMAELAANLPRLSIFQPTTNEWLAKNKLPVNDDNFWEGIDYLFTREWFNRLWTMQEFALASHATFVCGPKTATGSQFVSVANEFMRLGLVAISRRGRIPKVGYKDGYHFPAFASRYWEAKDAKGGVALELALQLGRFKEAKGSNAHDRVYALLGLLHAEVVEKLTVDYDMPWWEMYIHVGIVSLKTSPHMEWLAQCQSSWRPKGLLPTWCPNLQAENEASPFFYDYYFAGFIPNQPSTLHVGSPLVVNNHLLVQGVSITKIASIAKFSEKWDVEYGPFGSAQAKFQYTSRWMNECLDMAREIPGISSAAVPEAFVRTLIADVLGGNIGRSYETLKEMWECVQAWIFAKIHNKGVASLPMDVQNSAHNFLDSLFHACRCRRFFVTADRRLALGPDQVEVNDEILIIKNACKYEKTNVYRLIGPTYVRGLMMGQVPKLVASGRFQWITSEIV